MRCGAMCSIRVSGWTLRAMLVSQPASYQQVGCSNVFSGVMTHPAGAGAATPEWTRSRRMMARISTTGAAYQIGSVVSSAQPDANDKLAVGVNGVTSVCWAIDLVDEQASGASLTTRTGGGMSRSSWVDGSARRPSRARFLTVSFRHRPTRSGRMVRNSGRFPADTREAIREARRSYSLQPQLAIGPGLSNRLDREESLPGAGREMRQTVICIERAWSHIYPLDRTLAVPVLVVASQAGGAMPHQICAPRVRGWEQ